MNRDQIKALWEYIQSLMEIRGGLYVDAFAIVILIRLLGPLFKFPPLSVQEAGTWAATIGAFAYSNGGPKPS